MSLLDHPALRSKFHISHFFCLNSSQWGHCELVETQAAGLQFQRIAAILGQVRPPAVLKVFQATTLSFRSKMSAPEQARMDFDSIDESKVIVHHACCCCYDGCVPEVHHIGCAAQKTVLCLECDLCCKTGAPCLCCGCCAFRCVDLTTCCKAQGQFFCCVTGSAFPPDDEVPCMLNVCFLNCFPRLGCCMRLGDMKAKQMPWESEATTTSD